MPPAGSLLTRRGQAALASAEISPAGCQAVETAQRAIDSLTGQIVPLRAQLRAIGRREVGPRALQAHYGIGPLTAVIIWAELGDPRRFAVPTRRSASPGST